MEKRLVSSTPVVVGLPDVVHDDVGNVDSGHKVTSCAKHRIRRVVSGARGGGADGPGAAEASRADVWHVLLGGELCRTTLECRVGILALLLNVVAFVLPLGVLVLDLLSRVDKLVVDTELSVDADAVVVRLSESPERRVKETRVLITRAVEGLVELGDGRSVLKASSFAFCPPRLDLVCAGRKVESSSTSSSSSRRSSVASSA